VAEQLPDPIIVYGAPRSGTTYLQEMLNVHPEVFISHETRIFAWLHHVLNEATQERRFLVTSKETFIAYLRTELPRVVRDFYRSLAAEARYWGDKNPGYPDRTNGDCLGTIADLFPAAWFVHIIRDGRDVCSSLVRMKDPGGAPWVEFDGAHLLWASLVDNGCEFGRSLPPERYLEVRYERLVTDDIAVARELFGFLGLDLDPAVEAFCLEQQRERTPFSNPARDLSAGATGSPWSTTFTPEQRLRSLELIGDQLVRYAYETEVSLEALRAGIEAEARVSVP
jgi:hypothetical protein